MITPDVIKYDFFNKALLQHANNKRTALYTPDGKQISYFDLNAQANLLNNKLSSLEDERQLIFILCQQNVATVVAIVAMLTGKHVAILIPETINEDQLQDLISNYQPNIIYRTQNESIQFLSKKNHKLHSELCIMLSTSGSTGTPKQVKLSKLNFFENAKSIVSYLNIDEKEKAITSLPLNYSYGLSIITSHLLAGASILVTDASIMTRSFWDQLEQFQISTIAGVPYTYKMFERLKFTDKKLPYLKMMTQAGGKLDVDLVHLFAKYAQQNNKQFFIMYGQTEATARMSYLKSEDVLKYPESIGLAIPGGHFKLVDDNKKPISNPNEIGELVYQGPNVMMGYALDSNDLEKSPELDELQTGDLAYYNSNGLYFVTGRQSRFLKIFGLRVSLSDIENNLKERGFEAICSGQDDQLAILIMLNEINIEKSEKKHIEDNIRQIVREQLNIHPDVIKVKACQSVPLNDNGKVDYKKVYEMVWLSLNHGNNEDKK
ncbi:MAG: AMP-binding protein [Gammaproteobacteria bacterium]|nr:AMP-binding protein [Gammaproteobacteria bacterium]